MTVNGHEHPGTGATRLGPANQARRDQRTEKLAAEIVSRLGDMPDAMLTALAIKVLEEFYRRRRAS